MKAADLRDLTLDELKAEQVRLLKENFNLRIKRSMDQLPQSHLIKQTRRDIARVKTIMREKSSG
ncbi:MAG: 50S ribosomal protein L29 [Pseudomonadales bacterium]|nr:50S ribosomal protein L29 [Pseudomonadales bacterium]